MTDETSSTAVRDGVRAARRRNALQLAGSLAAAAAIAAGTVAVVTAKLGTTSVAALEAREERAQEREDVRQERAKDREDARDGRRDAQDAQER